MVWNNQTSLFAPPSDLCAKINARLSAFEEPLTLGLLTRNETFHPDGRLATARYSYRLEQPPSMSWLHWVGTPVVGIVTLKYDAPFREPEYVDERLELGVRKPLHLEQGVLLRGRVVLKASLDEGWPASLYRDDEIKAWYGAHRTTDMRSVIPTDLFLHPTVKPSLFGLTRGV